MHSELDVYDRRILALLQEDASLSSAQIAEQVGLSQSPCWRRIQRLKEEGVIRGQVTLLDRKKIGLNTQIFAEVVKRPYITVGFAAWLLLVPLAITSTKGWIKRLGRNWARLHTLVYAIGVLVILHFWWLVKSDIREPLLYASILALLLGWRGWKWFSRRRKAAAH